MAGAGFKDFQAGEVLTASDVDTYLMQQSVMVFADTTARDAAITSPSEGMFAYLTGTNLLTYYDGAAWQEFTSGGGGVTVSATAPASPDDGALWWDSDDGELYLYYNDGSSSQWVAAAGPSVTVAATAPTGYEGQLWLDSTDGSMYVYYTDPGGGNAQWIGAVSRSGGILQVVSTTKTDTFSSTSTSFADITGLTASITPSSTSSKIMAIVTLSSGADATRLVNFRLMRDAVPISVGDAESLRSQSSIYYFMDLAQSDTLQMETAAINFLDSPATTSTVTYKMQLKTNQGTVYVNRTAADIDSANYPRLASTITLMEVAG